MVLVQDTAGLLEVHRQIPHYTPSLDLRLHFFATFTEC